MARPQFTKEEETLISFIRKRDQSAFDTLLRWLPWLLITATVFTYGFLKKNDACVFAGFIITFYLLCHVIYYQVKPSWQLKPLIEKYEASYIEQPNQSLQKGR